MSNIAVSFSRKNTQNPADHSIFGTATGPFENIKNFVLTRPWSPIVFRDGVRKKTNFLSSSLIALDFDSGEWTLDDAVKFSTERRHAALIATTKSHRKVKGSLPACDRFRVIILALETTSLSDFEHTMKQYMVDTPCDKSCKDGARFYYPCKEIYATLEGTPAKWLAAKPKHTPERPRVVDAYCVASGEMPWWVRDWINNGVEDGVRHHTCYKIGAELTRIGYPLDNILTKVLRGPLAAIGACDVERAVTNGALAAELEMKV